MKHFCTFCFLLLLLVACKKKPEQTQPLVENISASVYASGVIRARNQYQVFTTVPGIIQDIPVTEGDMVKKGDVLLRLANEASKLNTENARLSADYAAISANTDKLNEQRLNIDLAKSKMVNDSLLMIRQLNLWKEEIGTRNQLDQAELAFKNSQTYYQSAKLRYNDLKKQLNFSAEQAGNNVKISSVISGDYAVTSKVTGKVYSLLKKKGEVVNTQTPIAVIGDANDFFLELQVDEFDIAKIQLGQEVLISLDSYKGQVFTAKVSKIEPIMNERSRSLTIEASFIERPATLYPFLTAEANIVIQTKEKVLTIPRSYLIEDSLVLLSNKEKRKVIIGLKDYQKAEVLKGLTQNDIILKPGK